MGESHHSYTGILLLVFAVLTLCLAIFLTVAQTRVHNIDEYKTTGNSKLKSANTNLLIAYILGYIAAGMAIVLAILYFGHVSWGIKSEVPHLILFFLLFALVLVSGIFGFIALSDINNSGAQNKQGSTSWIWAALAAGLIGLIVLVISGAWRAQYKASGAETQAKADAASAAAAVAQPTATVYTTQQATYPIQMPSEMNVQGAPQVMQAPSYQAANDI